MKTLYIKIIRNLERIGLLTPYSLIRLKYFLKFGRKANMKNPQTLNEKILWLEFHTDTSRWTELADKYGVRNYIEQIGLGHTLVKLYGKYDRADEIDFDTLPSSFVIKTNNGSGQVWVVEDKSKLDIAATIREFNRQLDLPFGITSAEPHYRRIKPCIIIEEYLQADNPVSSSLIDYKIWCFNGKPCCVFTGCNRDVKKHKVEFGLYDAKDWTSWNHFISPSFKNNTVVPKPELLEQMKEYASLIAREFPQVRVDFYEVNHKIYFGELTFTSNGGLMSYFTPECLLELGNRLNISSASNHE